MNYGRAVRLVRSARGLSQKELAERVEADASFVSLLEGGKRGPSTEMVEKLAGALKVPVYLLVLLASDREDLKGISPKQAEALGQQLLELVLGTDED